MRRGSALSPGAVCACRLKSSRYSQLYIPFCLPRLFGLFC
nr:MAG TPA: hypothetical protein [Caudoviricetes sp.]